MINSFFTPTYLNILIAALFLTSCQLKEPHKETPDLNFKDTTITFLWRDLHYDLAMKDSISSIFLNTQYLNQITPQEKAALGYVATFVGNECWWSSDTSVEKQGLDCKIISALGLGYQCSETHLGYLRKWFANDTTTLSTLDNSNCPLLPNTANTQDTFHQINIHTQGDSITVFYRASGVNLRDHQSLEWTENVKFVATDHDMKLIAKERVEIDRSPVETMGI